LLPEQWEQAVGSRNSGWTCLAAALLACASQGLAAHPPGAQSQQLMVTARVLERASLRVVSQPAFVDVTDNDIVRRYVDVGMPVQVEVTTNVPGGMHLSFGVLDQGIRQAQVRSTQRVTQSARGAMRTELIEVHLRLELSDAARAGRHAWPVQISAGPL
jgi:hypothetical protein